jgi:hypothetical protein
MKHMLSSKITWKVFIIQRSVSKFGVSFLPAGIAPIGLNNFGGMTLRKSK